MGGGGGQESNYGTHGGVGGGKQRKNVEKFHEQSFFSSTKICKNEHNETKRFL